LILPQTLCFDAGKTLSARAFTYLCSYRTIQSAFNLLNCSTQFNQIMPTSIKQVEDTERGKTILRIEGSMTGEDAVLLEKIALGMREKIGKNLTIDLADLNFLDSDSAPILKRLEQEHNFEVEGLMIFLQKAVEENESRNED